MKLIAFYLPQYHPIAENDVWWGKGFTEWRNVTKARALFWGHNQPQLPADLGYYDLRLKETKLEQIALAKKYGIHGFCYYHYWFNGKMLLETPLNQVLRDKEIDFPFCLCWANENWTRRWDGKEKEVLIEQNYNKYNLKDHMEWLSNCFKDDRYIKINGNPLFLIYKAEEIPNLKKIILGWRAESKKYGFNNIHVCAADNSQNTLTYEEIRDLGFDSIYEFEPNLKRVDKKIKLANLPSLNILEYRQFVDNGLRKSSDVITTFPGVFMSWDNTPRRGKNATIIQNDDVSLYKNWLVNSIERAKKNSDEEQLIFINAWNEWAEGCHLEPDIKNGHSFLKATKESLEICGYKINNIEIESNQLNNNYEYSEEDIYGIDEETSNYSVEKKRNIYVWGTGKFGLDTYKILYENDVNIAGFIDSDMCKWNTVIKNIKIYNPELIFEEYKTADLKPHIIIASMYWAEIEHVLKNNGLKSEEDYTINILNLNYYSDSEKIYISSKACFCNICTGDEFIGDYRDVCKSCSSTSSSRAIIRFISQHIDNSDLPVSMWNKKRYGFMFIENTFKFMKNYLEGYFCTEKDEIINNEDKYQYFILSSESILKYLEDPIILNDIIKAIKKGGYLIIEGEKNVSLKEQIRSKLKCNFDCEFENITFDKFNIKEHFIYYLKKKI